MQACLDRAVEHFAALNDGHGELFEVVILPPDGELFHDGDPQVLEFYHAKAIDGPPDSPKAYYRVSKDP
jgi:hypothetical protein